LPAIVPLALIIIASAVLIALGGREEILGLQPETLAGLVVSVGLLVLIGGAIASEYRGRLAGALQAAAMWVGIFTATVAAYAYRFELASGAERVMSAIAPGTEVTRRGEVVVTKGLGGSFLVRGRVNGTATTFVFDTGATTIVLTQASAERAGLRGADLAYTAPVMTANGRALAAPVTLERVAVGDIEMRRVRALVAKPGALGADLLGMSFLERLSSYEVRGDRLTLRARGS